MLGGLSNPYVVSRVIFTCGKINSGCLDYLDGRIFRDAKHSLIAAGGRSFDGLILILAAMFAGSGISRRRHRR